MLDLDPEQINLEIYHKNILQDHRSKILAHLKWHSFDDQQFDKVKSQALWLVQRQLSMKQLFLSIIDFLWANKIELPNYSTIVNIISNAYENFESGLIEILANKLTQAHYKTLNSIIDASNTTAQKSIYRSQIEIGLLKSLNHSTNTSDIKATVTSFLEIKQYFYEFSAIIAELNITDQATEYFAAWFQKSSTSQIRSISNRLKTFLCLLCYIKHQYYIRSDFLVDIVLKSVQGAVNGAQKQVNQQEKENRGKRNKAIAGVSKFSKDARLLIEQITATINNHILSGSGKIANPRFKIARTNLLILISLMYFNKYILIKISLYSHSASFVLFFILCEHNFFITMLWVVSFIINAAIIG